MEFFEVKSLFKSIIFFIFIIHSAYAKFEIKSGDSFDYRKAILFATTNSPDFDSITRQLSVSLLEEDTAKAKLFPSLDLSATHGVQDSTPKTGTGPWNSLLNLSLSESLYDNGVTNTNKQIAILTRKQNEVNLLDKKNSLSLGIISQYLTYSLNVKLLEIQNKQFKFLNKQYDLISKDYYQGIKTQKDYLRFKTQVNRGEIDLINAKNTLLKSKQELERLIGVDISSTVEINFLPISFENIKNKIGDTQVDI
jgi:outer membrane protein TolC